MIYISHKLGFNEYEIKENITTIFLQNKKGEKFETIIDTEDLSKVRRLGLHWHPQWLANPKKYYVAATEYVGGSGVSKSKTWKLHSVVMNAKSGETVDHINHEPLDNRKENLRIASINKNTKHRADKNSNNHSGYRNVSRGGKWWKVQLMVDGKNTILKKFPLDELEEAGVYAKKMRQKYYGEFQGLG